jgi:gliding motility-associated-like protein
MATSGGQYLLTAEWERNGCISVDSVTIGENTEAPEVTLGYIDDALDCNVQEVTMLGLDVFPQEWTAMFEWTDAESGTVVSSSETPSFEHAGAYNLTVEFLENGCATEVQDAALVESEMPVLDLDQMVLPNVITPDNNGRNDRFVPFIPGQEHENVLTMMEEYHIQVHNRWGQLLFQNEGMPLQWDGRAGGQLVDPGAYIVSVQYLATCGGMQSGSLKTTLEVIH